MRGIHEKTVLPEADGHRSLPMEAHRSTIEIDTTIYDRDAVFQACYRFTDRCHLFLSRSRDSPSTLVLAMSAKHSQSDLKALAGDLCNELIDQQLRSRLAREAGPIRELIVAQAFAEGNLLDPQRDDGDYHRDPLGIGHPGRNQESGRR